MTKKNKRFVECLLVFLSVGSFYYLLECIYKSACQSGSPHWTMFILAGFVGLLAMLLNDKFTYEMDFGLQVLVCTIVTTALEYVVGIIFNADYSIWDYRELPMNMNGMICLQFSCLWAFLFTMLIPILDYVERKVFDYKSDVRPYYKICGKKIFQFN